MDIKLTKELRDYLNGYHFIDKDEVTMAVQDFFFPDAGTDGEEPSYGEISECQEVAISLQILIIYLTILIYFLSIKKMISRKISTVIGLKYCIKAKISLEYKEKKGYTLSISGDVYEKQSNYGPLVCEKNLVCCGQCDDEIREIVSMINNPEEKKQWEWVLDMWKKYHLNDLHAGTPKQERFLEEHGLTGRASNYDECCKALDEAGILVCNGYEFGSGWLFRKIPAKDLNKIINFIKLDLYFPEY